VTRQQQAAAHQRLADAKRARRLAHVALAKARTANAPERRDAVRRAQAADAHVHDARRRLGDELDR